MMIKIEYPSHTFRIKNVKTHEVIFDELRKSWLRLTPEEWVRQNFVQYLVKVKQYPPSLIAIEKEIFLGEMKKRFDILVYNSNHHPWMMIECKEMNVEINQQVLEQLLRYNIVIPVTYLIVTNGTYCVGYKKMDGELILLQDLPAYVND